MGLPMANLVAAIPQLRFSLPQMTLASASTVRKGFFWVLDSTSSSSSSKETDSPEWRGDPMVVF